jgi:DNA replicative helicase MCM subunit Mcm2 (Cdc46/Mcm family)
LKKITNLVKKNIQHNKPAESEKENNITAFILDFIPSSKMIPVEELMIEGNYNGFKDSEIREELEKLKQSGKIMMPKKGYLQKK